MIYYSAEARGYALMMACWSRSPRWPCCSRVDTPQPRWWVALRRRALCGAMYTHYTACFVLAAQLGWLFWAHPEARRPALIANAAAAVALPAVAHRPAQRTSTRPPRRSCPRSSRSTLERRASQPGALVDRLPVRPACGCASCPASSPVIALLAAALGGAAARGRGRARGRAARSARALDRRVVLVVALALAVPVGDGARQRRGHEPVQHPQPRAVLARLALALARCWSPPAPRLRWRDRVRGRGCVRHRRRSRCSTTATQRPNYEAAANYVDARAPGPATW